MWCSQKVDRKVFRPPERQVVLEVPELGLRVV